MPLIRLHVVGADDSPEAQRLKLDVRDAVLEYARVLLAGCADDGEAWAVLEAHCPELEAVACRAAGAEVSVRAGVFPFPDREYSGALVPAGAYRAVRVVIGPGEGRNWWCVLYPSMCLASEDGYYSVFGRWLEQIFGGESA